CLVLRSVNGEWVFAPVEVRQRHVFRIYRETLSRFSCAASVFDNLRTGVDKPDLYGPQINRSYAELASHYAAGRPGPRQKTQR
ncbi:hypothetical protein ABLN73_15285, partial [Mycobacterium tuberculosis]